MFVQSLDKIFQCFGIGYKFSEYITVHFIKLFISKVFL